MLKSWKIFIALSSLILLLLGVWIGIDSYRLRYQKVTSWYQDSKGDCAVVLTGGPGRVREGFDLLQRGDVRKLIISGVNPDVRLLDIFPQRPFYPSVQNFNVILESHSRTTFGNQTHTLPLLEKLGCVNVLLVTSQVHMPRAHRLFTKRAEGAGEFNFIKHSIYAEPTLRATLYESLKKVFYEILF